MADATAALSITNSHRRQTFFGYSLALSPLLAATCVTETSFFFELIQVRT